MLYKAFISYSHAADGKMAPAIQRGLHRFGRPWFRGRAIRVFRDATNLSISPGLWSSIESALAESEYLLLLISPQAARSKWVCREVDYWVSHRSAETLLLVLTEGEIAWEAEQGDFDWKVSTLPANLKNVYREEPNWVDLRWIRDRESLFLQDPRFRDKIADISAALLGRPKDELVGEDVRQQRRARRLTVSAVAALVLLTLSSTGAAIWANYERHAAIEEEQIAVARQLAAESEAVRPVSITVGTLLAIESARLRRVAEADAALQDTVPLLLKERSRIAQGDVTTLLQFSADGAYLATASKDRSASVFEMSTGKRVARFTGPDSIQVLAIAADARYLATGSAEGSVRLFDVREQKQLAVWSNRAKVMALAFSPDDRYLAAGAEDGVARVFAAGTPNSVAEFRHGNQVVGVSFSADGRYLMTGSYDMKARVIRTTDWRILRILPTRASVSAIAITRDSQYVGAASFDLAAHVFEAASGKEVLRLPAESAVQAIAFSRDERYGATGGYDKTARVFEISSGKLLSSIPLEESVDSVAFSPDGRILATRDIRGRVGLFEPEGGTPVARLEGIKAMDLSPLGGVLAVVAEDGTVRILDYSDFSRIVHLRNDGDVFEVAFSGDGQRVAVAASEGAKVFAIATGEMIAQAHTGDEATTAALSRDGRYLAVAMESDQPAAHSQAQYIDVFDIDEQRPVAVIPLAESIEALVFTPDGGDIITAGREDGKVCILNVRSGKSRDFILNAGWTDALELSADGNALMVKGDKRAEVVTFPKGVSIARFEEPYQIFSSAISPDSKFLVTGNGDQTLRIYQVAGRAQLHQLGELGAASAVAFSSNGQYIASGSTEKSVAVIEVSTGKEQARWDCGGKVERVEFSSDDRYVVCAAIDPNNASVVVLHRVLWRIDDLLDAACAGVGRNFYESEWRRYFGNAPYRKTCSNLPIPELSGRTAGERP